MQWRWRLLIVVVALAAPLELLAADLVPWGSSSLKRRGNPGSFRLCPSDKSAGVIGKQVVSPKERLRQERKRAAISQLTISSALNGAAEVKRFGSWLMLIPNASTPGKVLLNGEPLLRSMALGKGDLITLQNEESASLYRAPPRGMSRETGAATRQGTKITTTQLYLGDLGVSKYTPRSPVYLWP